MEYIKQNLVNGQTLHGSHIEHIEDGIVALTEAVNELNASGGTVSGESPIRYVESNDANLLNLRDFESGTYVLSGKFRPFSGSTASISFASALLVNIITKTAGTHVQVFYPVNNCVQFLDITDDSYTRTNVYLNELLQTVNELVELVDAIKSPVRIGNVNLLAANWVGTTSPYSQVVTIEGVTEKSQVDLKPDVEQLAIFHDKDLAFVTENLSGVVTVYAIGDKPTNDYTIQVAVTEVGV